MDLVNHDFGRALRAQVVRSARRIGRSILDRVHRLPSADPAGDGGLDRTSPPPASDTACTGGAAQPPARLSIELVPQPLWGKNARRQLSKVSWRSLVEAQKARAGGVCEVCGVDDGRLQGHEVWAYDDERNVQTLQGLEICCDLCHRTHHIGKAMIDGEGEAAAEHMASTNGWTRAEVTQAIHDAFELQDRRSARRWTQDLSWVERELQRCGGPSPIDELKRIRGIADVRAQRLLDAGLCGLSDVTQADAGFLASLIGAKVAAKAVASARALMENRPIPCSGGLPFPDKYAIIDVETGYWSQDRPWLIGVLLPDTGEFLQLMELDPKRHVEHLMRLAEFLERHPERSPVAWSPYDSRAIGSAFRRCGMDMPDVLRKERWVDACAWMERSMALPLDDYGLKTVAPWCGFEWRDPDLSGGEVGLLYDAWLRNGTEFDVDAVRRYNEDDVRAVEHVVTWGRRWLGGAGGRGEAGRGSV